MTSKTIPTVRGTLTERYIAATIQYLPERQRGDTAQELRGHIMDAVDARLDAGIAPATAEEQVLSELGDPERLAASYTDRKLSLIGPDLFPTYSRILKQLMLFIVPPVAGLAFLGRMSDGGSGALSIGEALGIVVTIAVHIGFWTTLVFALIERYAPAETRNIRAWSLDSLPETSPRAISLTDIVGGIAVSIATIAIMVVQTRRSFATIDGEHVPVLNPDIWSFWLPAIIVVLLAGIVLEIAKYRVGHWTMPLAISNLALNTALAVPIIWLALNDRLINPDLFVAVDWPDGAGSNGPLAIIIAASVGLICLWDIIEGFYNALRNSGRLQAIG